MSREWIFIVMTVDDEWTRNADVLNGSKLRLHANVANFERDRLMLPLTFL